MKLKVLIGVVLLFLVTDLLGEGKTIEQYNCLLYETYIEGDLSKWQGWINEVHEAHAGELEWELLKLKAQYGLIGYYFGTRQKNEARSLLKEAEDQLDDNLKNFPKSAKLNSFRAAFYAFKIGLAVYKAPLYGLKMSACIKEAFAIDKNEPMVWLESGNSFYNRPRMFGGDKLRGLEDFKKSHTLFKMQKDTCDYLIVLSKVFIMKAYHETDQEREYIQTRNSLEKEYGAMPWIDEFMKTDFIE